MKSGECDFCGGEFRRLGKVDIQCDRLDRIFHACKECRAKVTAAFETFEETGKFPGEVVTKVVYSEVPVDRVIYRQTIRPNGWPLWMFVSGAIVLSLLEAAIVYVTFWIMR